MTLQLGNLLPGSIAKLRIVLTQMLEIVEGQYNFELPFALMPDYEKHGLPENDYNFSFVAQIKSTTRIGELSVPEGVQVSNQNPDMT